MENNIKVWKKHILKSQPRGFIMVNDQWLIDNANLIRSGEMEVKKTTLDQPIKLETKSVVVEEVQPISIEETETQLFDFDKSETESIVKTKKQKKNEEN